MAAADAPVSRGLLLFSALIAGFVITGVEITLGRLLAPFFGASLAVWSAIIASVIAALTAGYIIGGALIDRMPRLIVPLLALLGGGLSSALLGVISPVVLRNLMDGVAFHGFDYWWRLSFALAFFAVSCGALAMVAPAVLRLALGDRQTSGHVAGWVYGVGSAGSVAGILLPALWWVPQWGVKVTFILLGAMSVLPSALALASRKPGAATMTVCGVLCLVGAWLIPEGARAPDIPGAQVIFEGETPLQHVRILERREPQRLVRWLQVNEAGASQSILVEPGLMTYGVWDWLALSALHARPDDGRLDVLIIGLAAGTVSRLLHEIIAPALPPLRIVGVEIDPRIVELGAAYFGLDTAKVDVQIADGRTYLRSSTERFDLIILDAYRPPTIPAHLATVEFFEEVRTKLAPAGLVVLNIYSPAVSTPLLQGMAATWTTVFPNAQWVVGPEYDGFASRLLLGGGALPAEHDDRRTQHLPPRWADEWVAMTRRTAPVALTPAAIMWTDDRSDAERQTDYAYRMARAPLIIRNN